MLITLICFRAILRDDTPLVATLCLRLIIFHAMLRYATLSLADTLMPPLRFSCR